EVNEGVWNATRLGTVAGETKGGNTPPTIKPVGSTTVTVGLQQGATLVVTASDDGKPGQASARVRGPAQEQQKQTGVPINQNSPITTTGLPARTIGRENPYVPRDMVAFADAKATGLAVTWLHYRGPGNVTFQPRVLALKGSGPTPSGTAKTSVLFSEPGTYVIRAVADDGVYTTPTDFTVI